MTSHLKPHVYGNFKPPRGPKPKREPKANRRPGMSEPHLILIRQLPCCVTGKQPAGEAHHLKGTGERGMGLRSTDRWTVPLSHDAHLDLERQGSRNEVAWFKRNGIDNPHALACALWGATGDLSRMTRIIVAHMGAA